MMGLNNELIFYIIIALAVIVFMLLIYLYLKDSETTRKFRLYERAIEELNQNQITIHTQLRDMQKNQVNKDEILKLLDNSDAEVKEGFQAVVTKLDNLSTKIETIEATTSKKIDYLKEEQNIPAPIVANHIAIKKDNSTRVLEMHDHGFSNEAIAKELKITLGEIEFMIKRESIIHNTKSSG